MPSALAWITSRPRVVLSAFALFYAVLGLSVLAPEAVYSGDIGVKYVQARALGLHRFASMDIPYPERSSIPTASFCRCARLLSCSRPGRRRRSSHRFRLCFRPWSLASRAYAA